MCTTKKIVQIFYLGNTSPVSYPLIIPLELTHSIWKGSSLASAQKLLQIEGWDRRRVGRKTGWAVQLLPLFVTGHLVLRKPYLNLMCPVLSWDLLTVHLFWQINHVWPRGKAMLSWQLETKTGCKPATCLVRTVCCLYNRDRKTRLRTNWWFTILICAF